MIADNTWECSRCGLIHHILTQTCSCHPPSIGASTTNLEWLPKEEKPNVERDYYTKEQMEKALEEMERRIDKKASQLVSIDGKEEQEWRKALLDWMQEIQFVRKTKDVDKHSNKIWRLFQDLRTRFLTEK